MDTSGLWVCGVEKCGQRKFDWPEWGAKLGTREFLAYPSCEMRSCCFCGVSLQLICLALARLPSWSARRQPAPTRHAHQYTLCASVTQTAGSPTKSDRPCRKFSPFPSTVFLFLSSPPWAFRNSAPNSQSSFFPLPFLPPCFSIYLLLFLSLGPAWHTCPAPATSGNARNSSRSLRGSSWENGLSPWVFPAEKMGLYNNNWKTGDEFSLFMTMICQWPVQFGATFQLATKQDEHFNFEEFLFLFFFLNLLLIDGLFFDFEYVLNFHYQLLW